MVKVERIEKPEELTEDVQRQLTEEFKNDKKKVFGIRNIYEIDY